MYSSIFVYQHREDRQNNKGTNGRIQWGLDDLGGRKSKHIVCLLPSQGAQLSPLLCSTVNERQLPSRGCWVHTYRVSHSSCGAHAWCLPIRGFSLRTVLGTTSRLSPWVLQALPHGAAVCSRAWGATLCSSSTPTPGWYKLDNSGTKETGHLVSF